MTGQPNRTVREKKMALFFCNHFHPVTPIDAASTN